MTWHQWFDGLWKSCEVLLVIAVPVAIAALLVSWGGKRI